MNTTVEVSTSHAHTKGPWKLDGRDVLGVASDGTFRCVCSPVRGGTEADANARLIAAAPELLAACKQGDAELAVCASFLDQPATDPLAWIDGVRNRLHDAIAKAEQG